MNTLHAILENLRDTDGVASHLAEALRRDPHDEITRINLESVQKRRGDLARRLNQELRVSQSDLIEYHIEQTETDRYPALAVAKVMTGFQEVVTAIFDAIRSTPKQRYRPSVENSELSTLEFANALPIGSIIISMSIADERMIAVQSDLERTFDEIYRIISTKEPDSLKNIAVRVGISSISKAHDWAAGAAQFGLNSRIKLRSDTTEAKSLVLSREDALSLKEAIEAKSDKNIESVTHTGELLGIDVDQSTSYFHIRTDDGTKIDGRLADTFPMSREWAVHVRYHASLLRVTTIRYATGEEKIDWQLAALNSEI